jgi:hypothetical protein
VELYARAGNSANFANSKGRLEQRQQALQQAIAAPTTKPEEMQKAQDELAQVDGQLKLGEQAVNGAFARMNDKDFVNGFGSNGGEEFLSYLNIGEAMVIHGDAKFSEWDGKMTENLNRIQNDDGSWSGHHCITGKTFCTSAALMVLMVDRTTTPVMDAVKKR